MSKWRSKTEKDRGVSTTDIKQCPERKEAKPNLLETGQKIPVEVGR
jgi:hypothetical protein